MTHLDSTLNPRRVLLSDEESFPRSSWPAPLTMCAMTEGLMAVETSGTVDRS